MYVRSYVRSYTHTYDFVAMHKYCIIIITYDVHVHNDACKEAVTIIIIVATIAIHSSNLLFSI